MSNASVYFFGNLSGYPSAYPQDHTFEFFSEILSKMNSNSSLFIKRKDSLMHYAYVRQLDHEGRYLGICFVVNDIQFSNYEQLLQSFEWMVGYLVGDASIIGYDKDGSLVPLIDSFVELETVDHKMEYLLQYVFSNVSAIKLAPLRFDEISLGIKELLWGETTEEQFLYATAGNQLVQINKNVDNDTAGMIRQRSLLVEQRNYIESLTTANNDLIKQKENLVTANNDLIKQKENLVTANNDLIKQKGNLVTANNDFIKQVNQLKQESLATANNGLIKQWTQQKHEKEESGGCSGCIDGCVYFVLGAAIFLMLLNSIL